ncbi:acyl-CoA N-acyltransferase [Amylocarpus encephaloides]|uniref:Acyl-CoA N-acyltransferase n=1 Tax=Amylocarpus encephaloides TaxID=45428 RepID=A0A9P8C2L7_9HELO|nr:acyl-CoA N-acyltransferase [Amylocarpus encephaloides]
MAPTYTLSLATEADIPGILEVWLAAWPESPLTAKAFPRTEAVREWITVAYRQHMEETTSTVLVVTADEDGTRGSVVSFALLFREGAPDGDEKESGTNGGVRKWQSRWVRGRGLAEGMNEEVLGANLFVPMDRQHEKIMGSRRHIFLEVLGTHPDHQRKGFASRMLEWSSERADREGLEIYLDASAKGKPLYEKYGFRGQEDLMDAETKSVPMLRPKANA